MRLDPQRLPHVQARATDFVERRDFAGIAWRIQQHASHPGTLEARTDRVHDDVHHEGVVGHADSQGTPLRGDAVFRIYSMTKPLVSLLALMLAEKGLLRISDDIAAWLPAFGRSQVLDRHGVLAPVQRAITIEDLLTHRAGLSYDFIPDCPVADIYRRGEAAADGSRSLEALVELLADAPLARQPGSGWLYSYGTDVLAHVLEKITDTALDVLLDQWLFAPLGMVETGFRLPPDQQARLMTMYGMRELHVPPAALPAPQTLTALNVDRSYPLDDPGYRRGGLGLYSTVADYARVLPLFMDGRAADGQVLLSAATLDWMWANRIPQRQRPLAIGAKPLPGYGWNLFGRVLVEAGRAIRPSAEGEGGWAGAASTYFWVDRRHRFSGVVMTQFLGSEVPLGEDMQTAAYQAMVSS